MNPPFYALLILHTIGAFGWAFAIGFGKITLPFREWLARPVATRTIFASTNLREPRWLARWLLALMECPACLGWHIGLWTGTGYALYHGAGWITAAITAFTLSSYTCGSNFILGRVTGLIRD